MTASQNGEATRTRQAADEARQRRNDAEDRDNRERTTESRAAAEAARREWETAEDRANAERRAAWNRA